MIERQIGFTIEEIVEQSGFVRVRGRVTEESIRLGDVFTWIYRTHLGKTATGWIMRYFDCRPISLRLTCIRSYKREWEELSSGMTAELDLVGEMNQPLNTHQVIGNVFVPDSSEEFD